MGLATKIFVQGQFQQVNINMSVLKKQMCNKNNSEVAMESPSSNMMTKNAFSQFEMNFVIYFAPTIPYTLHHGEYNLFLRNYFSSYHGIAQW